MGNDDGRVPDGTGLSQAEPQEGLGPTGFDPSRDRLAILREAQARSTGFLMNLIPKGHRCGPIAATQSQWDTLTEGHTAENEALAALMPTEQDAIRLMHDCYTRLKKLGWNDAIYCPKDGSVFDAIEVGSTGIFPTHYDGEWPDGHWWASDDGDLCPSRPCLYRVTEKELTQRAEMRLRFQDFRDRDRSGEAGQTAEQAGPKARARAARGIAQPVSPLPKVSNNDQ